MTRERDRAVAAASAAVRRAAVVTPRPTMRAGTVQQPIAGDGTIAVLVDGDGSASTCELVGFSTVTSGDRVMVMFFPPHGAFVIGQAGGTAGGGGGDPTMGGDLSGLASAAQIVAGAVGTAELAAAAVTYIKLQDVSAASRLLGRGAAAGAGDVEEITLGAGLTMAGTTLSSTGGGSSAETIFPFYSFIGIGT